MSRALLANKIKSKVSTIKTERSLVELQRLVDELIMNEKEELLNKNIPDYIRQSIQKAKVQFKEEKGIPHERVMSEMRKRLQKKG